MDKLCLDSIEWRMMLCMSRTIAGAPPATRANPPGWRDPRLWIGVAIVAISVVAGARIIGAADRSVGVWAVSSDVAAGDVLDPGTLAAKRVRFVDPAQAGLYLHTDQALPTDLHLLRGLSAGELVPASALGSASQTGLLQVSLLTPVGLLPQGVAAGSHVDVYVTMGDGAARRTVKALADVAVVSVPPLGDSLAGQGSDRSVVIGVPVADETRLAPVFGAMAANGLVTVTLKG